MTATLLGTSSIAVDHFFKLLALGIACFSPVSIVVWAAADKLLGATERLASLRGGAENRRN